MANVIIRRYNTFFDQRTNVQFNPVLDKATGLYVGLAQVSGEQVAYFSSNPAYEVVTDAQLSAMTNGAAGGSNISASLIKDAPVLTKDILTSVEAAEQSK